MRLHPWTPAAGRAGLARDAAYLVRPDAYVGWCDPRPTADRLTAYLRTHGLRLAKLA